MKKLIVFILLFLPFALISQTLQIQGVITDSINKNPVPYSTVVIKNHNDSIITGSLSDEKGEFACSFNKPNNYKLVISNVGYKEKTVFFDDEKNSNKHDFGVIELSPIVHQLSETQVTASRPYMVQKFDKKVFNMPEGKIVAARTILDLLRDLPGVVVGEDGDVRYKGLPAEIYVDNQPSKFLYPKVEMIPVENIDNIELIDMAMRYGGDGKGGIINIKYKKITHDGFSGLLSTKPGTRKFDKIDNSTNFCNINYKKNKIIVLNNYHFSNDSYNYNSKTTRNINAFEQPFYQLSEANGSVSSTTHNDYFGVRYSPSENTNMNFGIGIFEFAYDNPNNSKFYEKNLSNNLISNSRHSFSSNSSVQNQKSLNYSLWHQFDTNDRYLEVWSFYSLHNSFFDTDYARTYKTFDYKNVDSTYKEKSFASRKDNQMFGFSAFYNNPISENSRWSVSYRLLYRFNEKGKEETTTSDTLIYSRLRIEDINDLSSNLSLRFGGIIKKWKIDGGINLQYKKITGEFNRYKAKDNDTVLPVNRSYFRVLPSATIAYEINENQELKLTLSQTVSFPYSFQLSDYIDVHSPYYWSSGNSKLKPVDFYSIYLSYTYSKEKWNATFETFFNYTDNEISYLSYPLSSLLYLSRPSNIANKTNLGVDISSWFRFNKYLTMSLSASAFNIYYNTQDLANEAVKYDLPITKIHKRSFAYNVKYNMQYTFKSYYATLYVNYFSREITFAGYNFGSINSSVNVSKSFFDNRLRVGIGVSNLFNNLLEHGSYSDNFGVRTEDINNSSKHKPLFYLSARYTFRYGDRGTQHLRGN